MNNFKMGIPRWCWESACQYRRHKRCGLDPWVGKIPWRRTCNPLQYCCLENPMDRGAWWAIVHRVAKSWTWLNTHIRWNLLKVEHLNFLNVYTHISFGELPFFSFLFYCGKNIYHGTRLLNKFLSAYKCLTKGSTVDLYNLFILHNWNFASVGLRLI